MSEMGRVKTVNVNGQEKTYKSGFTFQEYIGWLGEMPLFAAAQPLLGSFLSDYINRPDVRRSLNIPDSVQGWSMCSDEVSNKYRLQLEASLWIYKIMLQYNYKILFFSELYLTPFRWPSWPHMQLVPLCVLVWPCE